MVQSQVNQVQNQTQAVRTVQRTQTLTQQVHPSYHMQVVSRPGNQPTQIVSSSPEYRQISPNGSFQVVQTEIRGQPPGFPQ